MASHQPKFITVKLSDLTKMFNGDMVIPVGRKFAENMFLRESQPVHISQTELKNTNAPAPKPTIRVIENLEDANDE